ncbi:replicative DNA helicase [Rhodocaloribacter sp.]
MADPDDFQQRPFNIDDEGRPYPIEKLVGGGRRRTRPPGDGSSSGRVPPQAVDVEQSVLGAMLIEQEAIPRAIEILQPDAFYIPKHQKIYLAILSLFERGNPVDLITLTEELKRRNELDDVGGAYYLSELTTKVASAANVEYHARIIAEKSLLRKMIETMTALIGQGYDPGADAFELLDQAESEIFRISETQLRKAATSMNEVLKSTLAQLEAIHGREGGITGVPSGFSRLDALTGGWQNSDLIIIAARPSMGKTAFSLACARNAALHPQHAAGVAIFSLEMSAQQLAQRLLTAEARVDAQAARTGRLSEDDWPRLARAAGKLSAAPIFIDDTPGLSILELRAKCRRLKAEHDIGLVVVDYLQLMHGTHTSKNANREQEIAQISRSLKSLAKELNVPVIALSQLSRAVETRGGDKRPQLSDLRESGCLTGDTLVTRADTGARVPIRDLAARYPEGGCDVWALDPMTLKLVRAPVSRAFSTGIKPVYKITTRLGRTIRATANHKFLTIDGWKRLDALAPNDHLALPRHVAQPDQPAREMSKEEAALLGHLIGDGCTLPRHAIQYTTHEDDLAHLVADLARHVFGLAVAPRIHHEHPEGRRNRWHQVYLASTRHHTHGVRSAVATWLDELGVWGLRSHEKHVPERVFEQKSDVVAHFLRHLWATDGCIHMPTNRYPRVYYATSSPRLAHDVQALLLRLGIQSRLKRVPQPEKGRDQFHIILSGRTDLLRFGSRVGAVGRRRRHELARIRKALNEREANTNRDVIPKQVWRALVTPAMNRAGLTTRQMQAQMGHQYCGTALYKSNLSRQRARRVAEIVGSTLLSRLAESDVYWDRIVSIEPDGVEEVFDLTVPGPHNFVAEDIIVHNSIEQDADVVMFIYRPERYGITVDDHGNSTEGLAEIIIGKQRNGPIGDVRLAFVKNFARFENLTMHYAPDGFEQGGFEQGGGDGAPVPPPPGDAPF